MRQGVTVLWEAMIAEMRAVRLDLAARAPFTQDGHTITETRVMVAEWIEPKPVPRIDTGRRTASALRAASQGGFIEVG